MYAIQYLLKSKYSVVEERILKWLIITGKVYSFFSFNTILHDFVRKRVLSSIRTTSHGIIKKKKITFFVLLSFLPNTSISWCGDQSPAYQTQAEVAAGRPHREQRTPFQQAEPGHHIVKSQLLKHPPRRNNISLNTNVLGHQVVLKDLLTRWRCIIFFFYPIHFRSSDVYAATLRWMRRNIN